MQYNGLGTSDLRVSEICLGTMTFGHQNTLAEAHQQLDFAIAQGINFIDAAEMYCWLKLKRCIAAIPILLPKISD